MIVDFSTEKLTLREKSVLLAGLVLACGIVGYLFYRQWAAAAAGCLLFVPMLRKAEEAKRKARNRRIRASFRDMMNVLAASFGAGRQMEEALTECRRELGGMYRATEPILQEIDRMNRELRCGTRPQDVLEAFADRTGVEEIRDFVQLYVVCLETGGDLVRSMEKCAKILSEKITTEKEIRTIVQQKKYEGRLITGMPVVIILFLKSVSPGYLDVLYETVQGRVIMTCALLGMAAAYRMTERITDIDV